MFTGLKAYLSRIRTDRFGSLLLSAILFELMLGGGGRLTALGPISLRMILFAAALVLTVFYFLTGKKLTRDYTTLLAFFSSVLGLGLVIGLIHGSEKALWWEDVKPLLYVFILPFFYFSIAGRDAERISGIIQACGLILALLFFAALVAIHTGFVPFLTFYHFVLPTEEFFFRGELTFFYKGFLYLPISFIFIQMSGKRKWWLIPVVLALLLTFTRGFWFALLATYCVYLGFALFARFSYPKFLHFVLCLLATVIILAKSQFLIASASQWIDSLNKENELPQVEQRDAPTDTKKLNPRLLGDRAYSDDSRWRQVRQVLREMDLQSVLLGHGFGQGIPIRPIHMEISYLEIFHKQGIIGLFFWLYLLILLYRKYREADGVLREPFFFGALFVFIQSTTNQFVNNPIGLAMVLVSLVCLDKLKAKGAA